MFPPIFLIYSIIDFFYNLLDQPSMIYQDSMRMKLSVHIYRCLQVRLLKLPTQ